MKNNKNKKQKQQNHPSPYHFLERRKISIQIYHIFSKLSILKQNLKRYAKKQGFKAQIQEGKKVVNRNYFWVAQMVNIADFKISIVNIFKELKKIMCEELSNDSNFENIDKEMQITKKKFWSLTIKKNSLEGFTRIQR